MTGSRCSWRINRHSGWDPVDAVPEQSDMHRAGIRLQRKRAGRLLIELVRLEHDQDSAACAGGAEPGARSSRIERRHPKHVRGGATKLHRSKIDRPCRAGRKEQGGRQQCGAAHVEERTPVPGTGPRSGRLARGGGPATTPLGFTTAQTERARMPRTVAAYHRAPPCAVGTSSRFKASAIARSESPLARCR
jgi:hypothetical protein